MSADLDLDRAFAGNPVPTWLRDFERRPYEALDGLLLGAARLGILSAAEPTDLLARWMDQLGDPFIGFLDTALATWIGRSWRTPILPGAAGSAALTAAAWIRAADTIASEVRLREAATELRHRLPSDRNFLAALGEGPSRDPEGRAWFAIARHQADRVLTPWWWRFCTLPPDEPWYHGVYGVQGLRGLPPPANEGAGFRIEVAEGLLRLADALAQRCDDGWLDQSAARAEVARIAQLMQRAFPFPERWAHVWVECRERGVQGDLARSWLDAVLPSVNVGPSSRRRPLPAVPQRRPDWQMRAQVIAGSLREHFEQTLPRATQLLDEQTEYAEKTGDSYNVVRTACSFASKIRHSHPTQALIWVELAQRFDPWNAYTWTTMATVLLALHRGEDAMSAAREAFVRFPDEPVASTTLADVLLKTGQFVEAEAQYRDTVSRFPANVVAHCGLGDALLKQEMAAEAEAQYRDTMAHFPANVVARNGLADALLKQGRAAEAEAQYRESLNQWPDDPIIWGGIGHTLIAQRRWGAAVEWLTTAARRFPADPFIRTELGVAQKGSDAGLENVARPGRQASPSATEAVEDPAAQPAATPAVELGLQPEDEESPQVPAANAQVPDLRTSDIDILVNDSFLVRRWLRAMASEADREVPGRLRQRARDLLERLAGARDHHADAAQAWALLSLEEGLRADGLTLLRQAVRRFPGSVRVRYALARVEREMAVLERKRLDKDTERTVVAPWKQLAVLEPRLAPVAWLGEGRAWLSLLDGAVAEGGARRAFAQLGRWVHEHRPADEQSATPGNDTAPHRREGVYAWYADEVQRTLFGGSPIRGRDDLADLQPLRDRMEPAIAAQLDGLEEQLVMREARV